MKHIEQEKLGKVIAHNNVLGEIHEGEPHKCKEKTCVDYWKIVAEDYDDDRGWQT